MDRPLIMLFISTESPTFAFARRQVELACEKTAGGPCPAEMRVVDVGLEPETAEKYNIEALPTVIVNGRRIIGIPPLDLLAQYLNSALRESAARRP